MFQVTGTFQIFGLEIYFYSITLLIGILIAWWYGRYNMLKKGFDPNKYDGFLIFVVLFAIFIGARGWYVISNWDHYAGDFSKIIDIAGGGLAIQGGIVAGAIAAPLYIKLFKPGFKLLDVIDIAATSILFGQIAGRFGNFFNQEVYGNVIESRDDIANLVNILYYTFWFVVIGAQALRRPWVKFKENGHVGIYEKSFLVLFGISVLTFVLATFVFNMPNEIIEGMKIAGQYRMPLFLVESTINLGGLLMIALVVPKVTNKKGVQFASYFIWYGTVRLILEPLRNTSYNMGTSIGMSIAFVIFGTLALGYFLFGEKILKGVKINGK